MAEKISVEIGLDGGAEVQQQLEGIGQAGQKAFGDIQSAADQVNLDSTSAQFDELGSAGQAAFNKIKTAASGAAAFEQIVQGVKKVEGAFESLGNAAARVGARMTRSLGALGVVARSLGPLGIAVGALGGAFVKFGDDTADALNKLTVEAAKLGQTPQQFDRVQKALASLGIAADAVGPGLTKFRETLGEDFTGNLTAALGRFIEQLERMPDSVQRTQLAIATLGESLGGQVIAGLQTGAVSAQNFQTALAGVAPVTQQQIVDAAKYQQALNQLNAAWTELKAAFAPIVTPIFGFLTQEIKALTADIKALIIDVKALWSFLQALAGVFTAQGPEQMRAALQRVAEAYRQLGTGAQQVAQQTAQANQELAQTGQAGAQAGQQTAQGMNAAAQSASNAKRSIDEVAEATTEAGRQSGQITVLAGSFQNLAQMAAQSAAALAAAANQARYIANLPRPDPIGSGRPDPIGFAGGGMIGGRGTGTSDSNLAWVSRGEHIMPARAVAQPGVLHFLEALRRSGGNLRGVLDGMSRFALGGLVPRTVPAFAGGGAVGSMSHVTINFPGTPPISGLRASASVVEQLQKAAALAQVRSGGRKPSRYS